MWRLERPHNCEGMFPVNELNLKFKINNEGIFSPMEAGIGPENLLPPRSRLFMSVQFL